MHGLCSLLAATLLRVNRANITPARRGADRVSTQDVGTRKVLAYFGIIKERCQIKLLFHIYFFHMFGGKKRKIFRHFDLSLAS